MDYIKIVNTELNKFEISGLQLTEYYKILLMNSLQFEMFKTHSFKHYSEQFFVINNVLKYIKI